MTFAIILACTVAACFALRDPIKKWPVLFYALAILIDLAYIATFSFTMPRVVWKVIFVLIQKCTLSLAIFIVVMYIGVFSRNSKVSTWLRPIRSELSIIAWILSLGHMAVYLVKYLPIVLTGGAIKMTVLTSFILAIVLLVLLLVLGVTSFAIVKKRMKTEDWRKVQKWAYVFFMLVYVHLLFMLLPSALHGGHAAQVTTGVYSIVFISYAVLRIYRYLHDKNHADQDALEKGKKEMAAMMAASAEETEAALATMVEDVIPEEFSADESAEVFETQEYERGSIEDSAEVFETQEYERGSVEDSAEVFETQQYEGELSAEASADVFEEKRYEEEFSAEHAAEAFLAEPSEDEAAEASAEVFASELPEEAEAQDNE